MKISIIILVFFISNSLFGQLNYTLAKYTFNSTGGKQTGTYYQSFSSVGNLTGGMAASVNYDGYFGFLYPTLDYVNPQIISIKDVPHDQGLKVGIIWQRCVLDNIYSQNDFYSVWRNDTDILTRKQVTSHKDRTIKKEELIVYENPDQIIKKRNAKKEKQKMVWLRDGELWSFIAQIPAIQLEEYSTIAPTLIDSNDVSINATYFKILFHDDIQYYESLADSGFSKDNIPPNRTESWIAKNREGFILQWNEVKNGCWQGNNYPELNGIWYNIYSDSVADFICNGSNYLDTTTNLYYEINTDETKQFYKIIVSDKP